MVQGLVGTVAKSSGAYKVEAVEYLQGALHAALSFVVRMVVGSNQGVDAAGFERLGQGIRRGEGGVAGIGWSRQGDLQVAHHNVGRAESRLDVLEYGFVVVTAVGLQGAGNLGVVAHDVAKKQEAGFLAVGGAYCCEKKKNE